MKTFFNFPPKRRSCLQSTLIDNHKLRNSKDGPTNSGDAEQENLLCESIQVTFIIFSSLS
jgi:hypothetical protein